MMNVNIKLVSYLKSIASKAELSVDVPEGTAIEALLDKISSKFGNEFTKKVFGPKKSLLVLISIDGTKVGFDRIVRENETVTIMPPFAGG